MARLDGKLTRKDAREVRNFQRFLKLWPRWSKVMLTRTRWQKYLNVTPQEGWRMAKRRPRG